MKKIVADLYFVSTDNNFLKYQWLAIEYFNY
jgi:hypothetical protein